MPRKTGAAAKRKRPASPDAARRERPTAPSLLATPASAAKRRRPAGASLATPGSVTSSVDDFTAHTPARRAARAGRPGSSDGSDGDRTDDGDDDAARAPRAAFRTTRRAARAVGAVELASLTTAWSRPRSVDGPAGRRDVVTTPASPVVAPRAAAPPSPPPPAAAPRRRSKSVAPAAAAAAAPAAAAERAPPSASATVAAAARRRSQSAAPARDPPRAAAAAAPAAVAAAAPRRPEVATPPQSPLRAPLARPAVVHHLQHDVSPAPPAPSSSSRLSRPPRAERPPERLTVAPPPSRPSAASSGAASSTSAPFLSPYGPDDADEAELLMPVTMQEWEHLQDRYAALKQLYAEEGEKASARYDAMEIAWQQRVLALEQQLTRAAEDAAHESARVLETQLAALQQQHAAQDRARRAEIQALRDAERKAVAQLQTTLQTTRDALATEKNTAATWERKAHHLTGLLESTKLLTSGKHEVEELILQSRSEREAAAHAAAAAATAAVRTAEQARTAAARDLDAEKTRTAALAAQVERLKATQLTQHQQLRAAKREHASLRADADGLRERVQQLEQALAQTRHTAEKLATAAAEATAHGPAAVSDRYVLTLERMTRLYEELTGVTIINVEEGTREIEVSDGGADGARGAPATAEEDVLLYDVAQHGRNGEIFYTLAMPDHGGDDDGDGTHKHGDGALPSPAASSWSSNMYTYTPDMARFVTVQGRRPPDFLSEEIEFEREMAPLFFWRAADWLQLAK
ncbi:hypothetical protein CXG81DRAFT_27430 [Caulochytrium protostelioides]|uniref:Monopolin complex subunit Csm1/Pcs1 C-terminal domain-containing protein n=1 Tax=Caulochytrium protostelioides TaxID=1555241 RepID=A0A4P9X447_9FUNG|nr:hypothetical protein CXG81DRAFT_27430 [Caulochytrium protostelioides]|eukprot:RKO99835.1 hypothetical protein CXG81DRAFT_27430 [Caulochytrium protostelioides]